MEPVVLVFVTIWAAIGPVSLTRYDQIVGQQGILNHIKIDVEGQEAAVLRGGRETLNRFSPILFLELQNEMVNAEGSDPNFVLDELAQLSYEPFTHRGNSIPRDAILQQPISRIVAHRAHRASCE